MGYKPFGKNRVLVLPVPTSDMTAEEYKNTYGIELDSIELCDLILLQEEGKEAYPVLYIDKENNVLYTADKAFSYASGFEIVEGVSLVSEVIKTGTIENAKPIYFHPIRIESTSEKFKVCGTILNNSGDAFADLASLIAYMRSKLNDLMTNFDFLVSGGIVVGSIVTTPYLLRVDASTASLYYLKSDGTGGNLNIENVTISQFSDNVNKIN